MLAEKKARRKAKGRCYYMMCVCVYCGEVDDEEEGFLVVGGLFFSLFHGEDDGQDVRKIAETTYANTSLRSKREARSIIFSPLSHTLGCCTKLASREEYVVFVHREESK